MILNDKQIKELAEKEEMISPFVSESVSKGISHGLNSFGYDLRCGSEFKIFTNIKGATADPKNFSEDNFITIKGEESVLIPPNSFALASSLEYFKMPRNVTGLVTAKKTLNSLLNTKCENNILTLINTSDLSIDNIILKNNVNCVLNNS